MITGLFANLTPEQQKAALEYRGAETLGDPAYMRKQMHFEEPLRAEDLDIVGVQFGIRIIKREKGQSDRIELYLEDDQNYFLKQTFAAFWLDDLIKVAQQARDKADCEVIFKSSGY